MAAGWRGCAVLLTALFGLSACGSFEGDITGSAVVANRAKDTRDVRLTRYPGKGDNDPHPGVARAYRHPIHGIDVARYQGEVDWSAVRRAGTRFAFIKATEGGDYIDPYFRRNWQLAKAAGVPRGAYHFVYWCRPAVEQADWFVANVPRDPDALPPVLDVEWNNHSRTCRRKVSREDALAKIRILLRAMERHTGKVPIIYTDINFHRDVLEGMPFDNPFWLRSTAAEPHERYTDRRWTFWQWTQTGTVPGIGHEVDRNVFYGSDGDWATFLATGCDPRSLGNPRLSGRCKPGRGPVPTESPMLVADAVAPPAPPPPWAPPPPAIPVGYGEDTLGSFLATLPPGAGDD